MTTCKFDITEDAKNTFITERLEKAKPEKKAIVLVGGPGSGKSAGKIQTIQRMDKQLEDFANIDPDEILTALFKNENGCYDKVTPINNESFDLALKKGKNVVFDGTGRNFDWYSENVLKRLKNNRYEVHLVIVSSNISIGLARAKQRQSKNTSNKSRGVDEQYAKEVYNALSYAIPQYLSLDCDYADYIYLYDNTQSEIQLSLHTGCLPVETRRKVYINTKTWAQENLPPDPENDLPPDPVNKLPPHPENKLPTPPTTPPTTPTTPGLGGAKKTKRRIRRKYNRKSNRKSNKKSKRKSKKPNRK